MAAKTPPIMSIDIKSTGNTLRFKDIQEVIEFVEKQVEGYNWFNNLNNTSLINDIRQNVFVQLNQARGSLSPETNDERTLSQVQSWLATAFAFGLPPVGSPEYIFIEDVRQRHSATVAVASLAFLMGRLDHLNVNQPGSAMGLILAVLRVEGLGSTSTESAKKHFDNLSAEMSAQIRDLKTGNVLRENAHNKAIKRAAHRANILRKWQIRVARRANRAARLENESAIHDMAIVRKTYEEMMKLKAPVDYWRDKAVEHKKESKRYRELLLRWGWKVASVVLVALCAIAWISFYFTQSDKPFSAYLILVTIGVVITTMAFWAARIVVRLYISEHHLAIDADERATMAMTYLALIENGAADEKERALILAPLFRPSSDGIVKDDAAPDLSPAALLSKMLNK